MLCAVQYLTLVFIGTISAMSLRGFLKNLQKVGGGGAGARAHALGRAGRGVIKNLARLGM